MRIASLFEGVKFPESERSPVIRMIGNRRMQCKDIPDELFLLAVVCTQAMDETFHPYSWRMRHEVQETLERFVGPVPPKVFVTKARKLMKAKKLGGCECSDCRGDYHIWCGKPHCCYYPDEHPGYPEKDEIKTQPYTEEEIMDGIERYRYKEN